MNISESIVAELEPKILTGNSRFSSDKFINMKRRSNGKCVKVMIFEVTKLKCFKDRRKIQLCFQLAIYCKLLFR